MRPGVILIPRNGGGSPKKDNWFPSVKQELKLAGLTVIAEEFKEGHFGGDYFKPTFPELTHAILRNVER